MSQTKPARTAFYAAYGTDGPWPCGYCGDAVIKMGRNMGHVHHMDMNPWNNVPSNLQAMHEPCHSWHHRKGKPGNRKGAKLSDEVRAQMSASHKGKPAAHGYTPEVLKKIADAKRGQPHHEKLRHVCECGKVTNAGPMKRHQNSTGHSTTATQLASPTNI
jgi:hypothetical protein